MVQRRIQGVQLEATQPICARYGGYRHLVRQHRLRLPSISTVGSLTTTHHHPTAAAVPASPPSSAPVGEIAPSNSTRSWDFMNFEGTEKHVTLKWAITNGPGPRSAVASAISQFYAQAGGSATPTPAAGH